MYRRDQQEKHSLSSYFDERNDSTPCTTVVTSPVSPLATNVTMARTQTRVEQHVQSSHTSGGRQLKSCVNVKHHAITSAHVLVSNLPHMCRSVTTLTVASFVRF